jgi:hypothetical protein
LKQVFWNPKLAEHEIMGNAMKRLEKVAEMMVSAVKVVTPEGTESRPMYTRGQYAEKWWTARDAGALKASVRSIVKNSDNDRNAWIMCGNKKAYYAKIVEHDKPFFRKAINKAKGKAKIILAGG